MTLSAVTSILDNPPVSLHSGIMMLTNISGRTPQDAPAPFTPLEILESCHARIRHFLRPRSATEERRPQTSTASDSGA